MHRGIRIFELTKCDLKLEIAICDIKFRMGRWAELALKTYTVTKTFPREETFSLVIRCAGSRLSWHEPYGRRDAARQ
jgi:hypothetical protein